MKQKGERNDGFYDTLGRPGCLRRLAPAAPGEPRMNFDEELSVARTGVEELARTGDLPAGVMSTLEDIFRLIDALAGSSKASIDRLEREVAALEAGLQRVQGTASTDRAEAQAFRTEMRAVDRLDKRLDQSVSLIAERVTALEARP
jgi:hypothetical protein